MATPPIEDDVAAYEKWLRKRCQVVEADPDARHERRRRSAFDFLRASYFRWARTIEQTCPALVTSPPVLGVGDLHVENYGTWRDADGRLVWGINDFGEAAWMQPFVNPTAKSNETFWREIDACAEAEPPARIRKALKAALPEGSKAPRHVSRRKGSGSLGRPRFLVIANWQSGRVVREAKAPVPSA